MEPKILYEDEKIIGIDKPCGLVVNRSHTYHDQTLQDFLLAKYPELFKIHTEVKEIDTSRGVEEGGLSEPLDEDYDSLSREDFYNRQGVVHRIDKDTSGVLVVAKDPDTFIYLQKLFKKRKVTKVYYALTFGGEKETIIEVEAPLARNPRMPFKFAVSTDGRDAMTKLEKVETVNLDGYDMTLFKAMPKTGRTHQIRVHLLALNHPIVHDPIYNTNAQFRWSQKHFHRLMLHACSIEFVHPTTKELLKIESALPSEFNTSSLE